MTKRHRTHLISVERSMYCNNIISLFVLKIRQMPRRALRTSRFAYDLRTVKAPYYPMAHLDSSYMGYVVYSVFPRAWLHLGLRRQMIGFDLSQFVAQRFQGLDCLPIHSSNLPLKGVLSFGVDQTVAASKSTALACEILKPLFYWYRVRSSI